MRVAWLFTALIALLGSVLIFESSESSREMSDVVMVLKNRIQNQDEQLLLARSELKTLTQQLNELKEAQASVKPNNIESDVKEALRQEREKQVAEQDELLRIAKMGEKIKAEKERIQKTQQQLDTAKRKIDAEEKLIDFEILKAVVETSVQKNLNAKAINDAANAPQKGADRFGEVPFDLATMTTSVVHKENSSSTNAMARKVGLAEERKKIIGQQRTLDEDKLKLSKSVALYRQQHQLHASNTSVSVAPLASVAPVVSVEPLANR